MRRPLRSGRPWRFVAVVGAFALAACARDAELNSGQEIEGALGPRERRGYRFELDRGDYVHLRAAPTETERVAELSAVLSGPAGSPLVEADRIRTDGGGDLAWVAESAGTYRLEVVNPDPVDATRYRLRFVERRPARPADRPRAAAQRADAKASRLLARGESAPAVVEALNGALAGWRLVGDDERTIDALLALSSARTASDPDRAMDLCEQALAMSADGSESRIAALEQKGRIRKHQGDCTGALAAFEEAKRLALEQDDRRRAGDMAYNVGSVYKRCGPLDLARSAFEETLDLALGSRDLPLQALAHREFALIARWGGDLPTARSEIARALELADAAGDRQTLADVLHEAANVDSYRGELVAAREHLQRCLEINEALGNWDRVIPTLTSLGSLELTLRRPREARGYLQRALELASDRGDLARIAEAEREIGAAEQRLYRFESAEERYRSSLATAQQVGSERLIATALYRLGNLLVDRGRPGEALDPLSEALARQRAAGDQQELSLTLRALGAAFAGTGRTTPAMDALSEALALQRKQGDTLRTVWTLYQIARVQAESDPELARRTIEEAIAISQRVRSGLQVDALRAEFSEAPKLLFELYVDLLVAAGDEAGAFAANEQGRSRALLDLLAESQVDPRADLDPELEAEAHEIDERTTWLRNMLRDALANSSSGEEVRRIRGQLDEAVQAGWRLEAEIRRRSPRYRDLQVPATRTLEQVQALLSPDQALLEYWLGAERSYLFLVTPGRSTMFELPPAREIGDRVERFRAAMLSLGPPEELGREAYALYRDLAAPALAETPGVSDLIIVPDGPLNLLPFEALVTAPPPPRSRYDDLQYLVRQAAISYAPSATVLAQLHGRSGAGRRPPTEGLRFLAFADPDYDEPLAIVCPDPADDGEVEAGTRGARLRELDRLRSSREEARRIARRYGRRAKVYAGSRATEENVVSNPDLATAERVHFAVHGIFCESRPERSGLVLSLDGDDAEDGILETSEIFGLRLSADLVVLSACDTGRGRLVWGEGVVGLARAFFYAGAPSLVVSLWQVPDRSTADLMTTFYQGLDDGRSKADALRRAKLRLLRDGGARASPFYWAPFVLVGGRGGEEPSD